jgi:hypothetical protein
MTLNGPKNRHVRTPSTNFSKHGVETFRLAMMKCSL